MTTVQKGPKICGATLGEQPMRGEEHSPNVASGGCTPFHGVAARRGEARGQVQWF